MTYGYLLNKSSFRLSVEFVLVFSGTLNIYVLLLIALNDWHLCFHRAILRRKSTDYVLLPNFLLSGPIQHRFFSSWRQRCLSCVPRIFSPRQSRGSHVRSCLRVLRRRRHKSVCALCRAVCRFLRDVRNSVYRHVVAGFPAAFPFTSLFPLLHRHAVQGVMGGQTTSVRLSQMQSFLIGLFHDIFIFNIDGSDALIYIRI